MTLNSSRSLKLHVKYFKIGDRYQSYHDGVNGSRIKVTYMLSIGRHHLLAMCLAETALQKKK